MAEVALGDGEKVKNAVVTVASYYNDKQRQAIEGAGKLVGVSINEFFG
jgi:molecular chaperone DnaK (HSP70)